MSVKIHSRAAVSFMAEIIEALGVPVANIRSATIVVTHDTVEVQIESFLVNADGRYIVDSSKNELKTMAEAFVLVPKKKGL